MPGGSSYVALWRLTFAMALALELPIVALCADKDRRARSVLASLVGNAITHPALWFFFPRFMSYVPALMVGEACAIGVEGASLRFMGGNAWRRAMLISLAANLYSWAIGEWVMRAIGPALARYWWSVPH